MLCIVKIFFSLILVTIQIFGASGVVRAEVIDAQAGWLAYDNGQFEKAYDIWSPLAADNQSEAIYGLGVLYGEGKYVEQNFQRAQKLFLQAAEAGNSKAQLNLAQLYYKGLVEGKVNYVESLYWSERGYKNGNKRAGASVFHHHLEGLGTPINEEKAFSILNEFVWDDASTLLNNFKAFYLLCSIPSFVEFNSSECPADEVLFSELLLFVDKANRVELPKNEFTENANNTSDDFLFQEIITNLLDAYSGKEKPLDYYFADAQNQRDGAKFTRPENLRDGARVLLSRLAVVYLFDKKSPLFINKERALSLFDELGELGHLDSWVDLGDFYINGETFFLTESGQRYEFIDKEKKNVSLGFDYINKAAKSGSSRAQGYLGYLYETGIGTAVDKKRAYMWWSIAAGNGLNTDQNKNNIRYIENLLSVSEQIEGLKLKQRCLNSSYEKC